MSENNLNLTEGLNEDVITPQNESNGQNDAANDSELKLTFLGRGEKGAKEKDLGLCAVLQVGGKNYIFDVGVEKGESAKSDNPESSDTLIKFLEAENINKIDGLIITHFHGDHIGTADTDYGGAGFEKLLTWGKNENINPTNPFENCNFYLPHQSNVITWANFKNNKFQSRYEKMTQLMSKIINSNENTTNIIYPSVEGQEISIGQNSNTKIKFYNVSTEYFNDYFEDNIDHYGAKKDEPRYNNFSMVTVIEHFGHKIAITGDIEYAAQRNMAKVIADADVLQIEHHGFNYRSHDDYLSNLTAKIGIIPAYNYQNEHIRYRPTVNKIHANGGKVYYTGDCANVTVYSNNKNIWVDNSLNPMRVYTANTLDYGRQLIGDEDLFSLDVGVYSFTSTTVLNNTIADKNQKITKFNTAGKVIIEYISPNTDAKKLTVVANAKSGITATKFYRSENGTMGWTDWIYNKPHVPQTPTIYGSCNGGTYKLENNGDFEIIAEVAYKITQDKDKPNAGYFSDFIEYSLEFINELGRTVKNAYLFGTAYNCCTVVNSKFLSKDTNNIQNDKIRFRLLRPNEFTSNETIKVMLLIKGTSQQTVSDN